MQRRVTEEGEREKKLYADFMCYCKTGGSDLSASIAAAKTKLGELATDLEAAKAKHAQTKEELASAQVDRAAGEKAMAEATSLREKEAASYGKFKADAEANIAAINKGVMSIEKGMAGGFMQTNAAGMLRRVVTASRQLDEDARQTLVSFLSGATAYAPQSGQIVGILKELHDEMAAIQAYKELMGSKLKEKAALTGSIEAKSSQSGELGVAIAEMRNDAGDTGET